MQTVKEFIEEYFDTHSTSKHIRLIDVTTKKGINSHWIHHENNIIKKVKITSKYIFIFI